MKIKFSKSVNLFLILAGVLGGALLAIAVTPLVTYPPTSNDTLVNFDELYVGSPPIEDSDGFLNTSATGQTFFTNQFLTNPSPFTTDENGYLLPLRFGADISSENAGLYSLGHYIGLLGKSMQANGLFGRVGAEGRVTGPGATVRGFAGYLEYDPSLNPTVENNINMASLPSSSPSTTLLDDYIRISKGIPWAFYTENQSKFKNDVTITGQLTAENEPLVFADMAGPVSDPVVEINASDAGTPGNLEADEIIAEDFIATDNLSGQFFRRSASRAFNDYDDFDILTKDVYCPSTPTSSIRVGCDGGLISDSDAPTNTPYLGAEPVSTLGCRAYARKPTGNVEGNLQVFAYCWRPE